jgi:hypothetical protein
VLRARDYIAYARTLQEFFIARFFPMVLAQLRFTIIATCVAIRAKSNFFVATFQKNKYTPPSYSLLTCFILDSSVNRTFCPLEEEVWLVRAEIF